MRHTHDKIFELHLQLTLPLFFFSLGQSFCFLNPISLPGGQRIPQHGAGSFRPVRLHPGRVHPDRAAVPAPGPALCQSPRLATARGRQVRAPESRHPARQPQGEGHSRGIVRFVQRRLIAGAGMVGWLVH